MLAEPRQKKRYNLVPRGKALYEDENRFGTKMLEKMGWKKGQGLGANENGSKDFVRVRYKNDAFGLGFEQRDDQWTRHEEHFNGLLKTLNNDEDLNVEKIGGNESEDNMPPRPCFGIQEAKSEGKVKPKVEKLKEKISGVSLEERSKQSKVRVHYKKFTKGKDIAQYSEKDLANIFGKKAVDDQQDSNDFFQQLNNTFGNNQGHCNGLQTINEAESARELKLEKNIEKKNRKKEHGENENDPVEKKDQQSKEQIFYSNVSVNDYFKMKMEALRNRNNGINKEEIIVNNNISNDDFNKEEVVKKKKNKKRSKDIEKDIEQEPMEKKFKKTKRINDEENIYHENENEAKCNKKQKESKKLRQEETVDLSINETKNEKCNKSKNQMEIQTPNEISYTTKGKNDNLVQNSLSMSITESSSVKNLTQLTKEEQQKTKNKEENEIIEILDSDGDTTDISNVKTKKNKKSKRSKAPTDSSLNKDDFVFTSNQKNEVLNQQLENPLKTKRKEVISSSKNVFISDANFQVLDLEDIKERYNAFNIYPISSFCAEKFRNINLNDFTGSILPQIIGYGLGPDLQLDVKINKNDEERITNLWKGVLSKYDQTGKPKKTYKTYVQEVINARKAKRKGPKLSIKTWKRKNAFQFL